MIVRSSFLEAPFNLGDRDIDELLVTSFLDALPGPTRAGHGLANELLERLHTRFNLVRPCG
ncbi:hypothetical protein GCM10010199_02930 [Dactylosporangium roseum]